MRSNKSAKYFKQKHNDLHDSLVNLNTENGQLESFQVGECAPESRNTALFRYNSLVNDKESIPRKQDPHRDRVITINMHDLLRKQQLRPQSSFDHRSASTPQIMVPSQTQPQHSSQLLQNNTNHNHSAVNGIEAKEHLQHNSTEPGIYPVDEELVLRLLQQVDQKITREKSRENEAL